MRHEFNQLTFMLAACAALLHGCGIDAHAGDGPPPYPRNAYTATYEMIDHNKPYDWGSISSDGKGHILCNHMVLVRLEDYINNTVSMQQAWYLPVQETLSMDASNAMLDGLEMNEKLKVWSQVRETQKLSTIDRWWSEVVCSTRFESLGDKVVDGYHCRGYKYSTSYYPVGLTWNKYWYDKDTGALVHEDRLYFQEIHTTKLKTLTSLAIPEEAFSLPIQTSDLWKDVTGRIAVSPEERKAKQQESVRHARRREIEQAKVNTPGVQPDLDKVNDLHMRPGVHRD